MLLTYQGIKDLDQWNRFVAFVSEHLRAWRVQYWTATFETNANGKFHVHIMMQFLSTKNRSTREFFFEGIRPNARPNDLLGDGWNAKRWQVSVDRGHFYVWADKKGTVRDLSGSPCVEGNLLVMHEGSCASSVFGHVA